MPAVGDVISAWGVLAEKRGAYEEALQLHGRSFGFYASISIHCLPETSHV